MRAISASAAPRAGAAIFVILVAISSLSPLGINIIVPSLPSLAREFGVDYGVAQLTLSVFLASMAVFLILTGPLTDMFGRRPVLFAGLGIFLAATVAAALAPNISVLIAARVVQAAGAGAGVVIGRAAVGDLYERERAASMMGYLTMAYGLSPMLAPLIGGLLEEWRGWRASFVFLALVGTVVVAVAWRVLPETARSRAAGGPAPTFFGALYELARVPAFWAIALTNALASSVYFTFLGGGAFVSEHHLGLSPAAYGFYFILISLGYIGGNWVTGRHAVRVGPMRLVTAGGAIVFVAVLAMVAAERIGVLVEATFFVPTFFIGFANGLVTPNCVAIGASIRPRLAGTAVGIAAGLQLGVGAAASTAVALWIARDQSPFPLVAQMLIVAALTVAGVIIAGRLLRREA
ncbi:MAG: multidrug effflux MFS transporter [Propylenella sp.]